ncbi:TATA-box-binding protein [Haloarcula sp. H-GB5]
MPNVAIENIVGSGQFIAEFDLMSLAEEFGEQAEYEPEIYPGMYLRFRGEDGPLTTVYRTGKFIVVGAKTVDELYDVKEAAVRRLSDVMDTDLTIDWFKIQNFVCSGDVGRELELATLAVGLGVEQTEYEPEQFAGLLYKPNNVDCTVMIFRTGKLIVTGATSLSDAEEAYDEITSRIDELLQKRGGK